ncbi:ficolin-2 [Elysia marginata]|uniref:Ficolin-2 n=1 Tax=Elysia marginata TaxID=1093978 RepID=A0AAV4JS90_9GAST|nr:ficolin-2 [Elysia marginata]
MPNFKPALWLSGKTLAQRSGENIDSPCSARLARVEYRLSRLEDRLYASLLSQQSPTASCPGNSTHANLVGIVERLMDITSRLESMNLTEATQQKVPDCHENSEEPLTCERGMSEHVNASFILTTLTSLGKQIRCDAQTDGGGWIVIQRRAVGDVDFYRDWAAYREGFGNLTGDFWLGNDAIHKLTNEHLYELRIDMVIDGENLFAKYSKFKIENETDNYRLILGTFSGTLGEYSPKHGLSFHNNTDFSTYDVDNDLNIGNCAATYHGAWWYKGCLSVNLNGVLGEKGLPKGVFWSNGYRGGMYPTFTEMKIRRP